MEGFRPNFLARAAGGTDGFYPHPDGNLNDGLPEQQQVELRRFMQSGDGLVEIVDTGVEIIVADKPTSIQSVEEAVRLRQEREANLGS